MSSPLIPVRQTGGDLDVIARESGLPVVALRIWGRITSAYPSPPRGRGQGEGAENTVVVIPQILRSLAMQASTD
jgi:hypothetical protein